MHGSLTEQLKDVKKQLSARKAERKTKPKPTPPQAAKVATLPPTEPAAAPAAAIATPTVKTRPRRDILLAHLTGVRHCGAVGNLTVIARLDKDGSRHLCMKFDFFPEADARWEVEILPADAERKQGWVSSYLIGTDAGVLHIYNLAAKESMFMLKAA